MCRTSSIAAALFLLTFAPASAQTVSLEFDRGHVSLRAQNAPIRMILAEWTRLGGTQIVNGEGIAGAPVTLELTDISERQALDVLLRQVSGYILGPRQSSSEYASEFDRIVILPTSSAPRNLPAPAAAFAPPAAPPAGFVQDFPEEFVPNDIPVDQFGIPLGQGQVDPATNRRFRIPRDFVPPEGFELQPDLLFQPDPPGAEELLAPAQRPAAQPGIPFPVSPFVTQPGGLRPGEIAPVPAPQGRTPQVNDEP
jgi:hypothetical protein